MRFSIATAILASASFVAAQTTSASAPAATGKCAAQNIVEACKTTIQAQIDDCGGNDWICLCAQYTNLLTCYNNCPGSLEAYPVQNQVTSFCNAAAPLLSASSASAATAKPAKTSAAPTSSDATATSDPTSTVTGAGFPSESTEEPNVAGVMGVPVGGAIAVLLGVVGLL